VYFSKTGFKFNKKLIARQKLSDILQAVVSEYRQGCIFQKQAVMTAANQD
jgi:hypothetical protein